MHWHPSLLVLVCKLIFSFVKFPDHLSDLRDFYNVIFSILWVICKVSSYKWLLKINFRWLCLTPWWYWDSFCNLERKEGQNSQFKRVHHCSPFPYIIEIDPLKKIQQVIITSRLKLIHIWLSYWKWFWVYQWLSYRVLEPHPPLSRPGQGRIQDSGPAVAQLYITRNSKKKVRNY